MNTRTAKKALPEDTELLLYLDVIAYFPEFSHGAYGTVGEFVREYLSTPADKRPRTMFSGFCADGVSGVTELMERAAGMKRLTELRVVYDSAGSHRFSSVCLAEQNSGGGYDVYIIIGCNYRAGEYRSNFGRTSSWEDNFLGAVQTDTAEQKSIRFFYRNALKAAAEKGFITPGKHCSVTVSGHSKAGNLAQYLTVTEESVTRCVSFDGQGFPPAFLRKYREKIRRRAAKILSVCPDVSIAGGLLRAIPGARRVFIRTAFLREKGARIIPLYYHIPVSLLDVSGRLREQTARPRRITLLLNRISLRSSVAAAVLPFIDEQRGMRGIGRALMHFFKGRYVRALTSLLNADSLLILLTGLLSVIIPF